MKLLLKHDCGELGPYTIEQWNVPNGDDCLLIYMLKTLEQNGNRCIELIAVEVSEGYPDTYAELRP